MLGRSLIVKPLRGKIPFAVPTGYRNSCPTDKNSGRIIRTPQGQKKFMSYGQEFGKNDTDSSRATGIHVLRARIWEKLYGLLKGCRNSCPTDKNSGRIIWTNQVRQEFMSYGQEFGKNYTDSSRYHHFNYRVAVKIL